MSAEELGEMTMADIQVRCVTRTAHACEHITHLGNGSRKWTVDEAVKSIDDRTNTFHTLVNGVRAEVEVVHATPKNYVRTHKDGTVKDNLLSLPTCT
jgi:hypothetical protein